jgi:hypothetical protein
MFNFLAWIICCAYVRDEILVPKIWKYKGGMPPLYPQVVGKYATMHIQLLIER